jgi:hypothetical protein
MDGWMDGQKIDQLSPEHMILQYYKQGAAPSK